MQYGLLDTMSFMDPLPPFRMKQWKVIALLFIDALSVCRIPGLTAHLTSRRILFAKVMCLSNYVHVQIVHLFWFLGPLWEAVTFTSNEVESICWSIIQLMNKINRIKCLSLAHPSLWSISVVFMLLFLPPWFLPIYVCMIFITVK